MDFDIETIPAGLRVILHGRLTFTENEQFRRMLSAVSAEPVAGDLVTLDLGGVAFIDSAGLGLLLHARDSLRLHSASVALAGAAGQVERMLDLARFGELFDRAA